MRSMQIIGRLTKAKRISFEPTRTVMRPAYQYIFFRKMATLNGLPFKITREQANAKLSRHRRFLEKHNENGHSTDLVPYKSDPVKECYIPFHSADIKEVSSTYTGEYGIDRTEYYWTTVYDGKESRRVLESRTITDWYPCSAELPNENYPFGTLSTQIYAGFIYPRKLIEPVLQSHDIINIRPITDEMLKFGGTQKIVCPHEMKMPFALEQLSSRVYDMECSRAHQDIFRRHGADHSRVASLDINLAQAEISLVSYHVPAYVYETNVMDFLSYKIINAYSGDIHGNKIYSVLKSSLLGAGIGGALTFGFTVLTGPYLLIPQVLFRIIVGTSLSGMFSGALANRHNARQNYNFTSSKENEQRENAQYIETDDDIERRKLAAQVNKGTDYFTKDNICLPVDKCKLLGLNPDDNITIEMVKSAYHAQLKKWHPDFFREKNSQNIAGEMTKQLNDANQELTEILLSHQTKNN